MRLKERISEDPCCPAPRARANKLQPRPASPSGVALLSGRPPREEKTRPVSLSSLRLVLDKQNVAEQTLPRAALPCPSSLCRLAKGPLVLTSVITRRGP